MTLRTALLSGIAGLAIASAVAFGAQAQTETAALQTMRQQGVMMSSGNASEPAVKHSMRYSRHTVRSRPQDSTPAEQAATERLNRRQLAAAQ
jgi:hypothetical protein